MFDTGFSHNEIDETKERPVAENKPSNEVSSRNGKELEPPRETGNEGEDAEKTENPEAPRTENEEPTENVDPNTTELVAPAVEQNTAETPESFPETLDGIGNEEKNAGETEGQEHGNDLELPLSNGIEQQSPSVEELDSDKKDAGYEGDVSPLEVKSSPEDSVSDNGEDVIESLDDEPAQTVESVRGNELTEDPDEDEDFYKAKRELTYEDIEKNLDESLGKFEDENWKDLSLEEKKACMEDLENSVADDLGLKEKPEIKYYSNDDPEDYGFYDRDNNKIHINTNNISDGRETANTVAHESRHAWQQECAANPKTARDLQFKENLADGKYIRYEDDKIGYFNQPVEVDARNYGERIADRIPDKNRFSPDTFTSFDPVKGDTPYDFNLYNDQPLDLKQR